MITIKFKELEFGKHVVKGDSILPYATSEGLIRINDESDLLNLQNYVDGELDVIIDRTKAWYDRFKIPAWNEVREAYKKGKYEMLKNWQTTE